MLRFSPRVVRFTSPADRPRPPAPRPPDPITPGRESEDTPYSLGESMIGRGRKGSETGWQKRQTAGSPAASRVPSVPGFPNYCDPQRLAANTGTRGFASATRRRLTNLDRRQRSSTVARTRERRAQPHTTAFDPCSPCTRTCCPARPRSSSRSRRHREPWPWPVQSVLVHARPADGAAVAGTEELRGRLRVPGRRRGTPTPVPRPTGRPPPAAPRPRPSRPVRPAGRRSGRAAA